MRSATKVNFRTFQPPPNYIEKSDCSNNQLFLEDLNNEDNELWVFQSSQGFDISTLKNKVVSLQEETVFQNENSLVEEKSHKISISNNSVNKLLGYQLLLPSRSNSGLFPVSLPLVGHLKLTECISKPSQITPLQTLEEETEECLPDLRQRYVPFGSDKPSITINTSQHKHRSKSCNYHSNERRGGCDSASAKKKVSFKSPLIETQETNTEMELENINHFQQDSPTQDTNGRSKITEQATLQDSDFFQDSVPREIKSKKKKKGNKSYSNEYASNNVSLSREDKSLFEAPLISHDSTERAGSSEQNFDVQKLQKTAKKKELTENYDTQDELKKHKKSKKKKKSDKTCENSLKNNVENNDLLMQSQEKSESENIARFQHSPDLSHTKNSHNTSIQTELSENDIFQNDTEHVKHKKKKRKSNECKELSTSEKTQSSSMSPLTEFNEKKVSIETSNDSNSQNIKCLSKKRKGMQPLLCIDKTSQHKTESVRHWEEDVSFTDDQKLHKIMKKKELSESDGSQDDIKKHKKSKKKKMSEKLRSNEALASEEKLPPLNATLIQPEESLHTPHSPAAQNFNEMTMQGELSGNNSFQIDTKHKKSKKRKLNECISNTVSASEDEKLPTMTPLTPLDECSSKRDLKTEASIATSNSSKANSVCEDKSQTKKKAKKYGHKNSSFLAESLNEFQETDQSYEKSLHTEKKEKDFEGKYCTSENVQNYSEKDNKHSSSKCHRDRNTVTNEAMPSCNINVGEGESESIHTRNNTSIKKERKKNHGNNTDSKQVLNDESHISQSLLKGDRIKKEKSLSIKKHKKKKKNSSQRREETSGDSIGCEVSQKFCENDVTVKEERPSISSINIKQECPLNRSNETSIEGKKNNTDKQLEHCSPLTELRSYTIDGFSGIVIKKEKIDSNHNCIMLDDKDNSKHMTTLQKNETFYLNTNDIKKEFPPADVKLHKKNKKRKMPVHSESLPITMKQEDVLSHEQTNELYKTDNNQNIGVIKQEVLSDCDDKLFIKQEHSDSMCDFLTKEIKKEIKPDPDCDSFIVKKYTKRKRNENSDESLDAKSIISTNDCSKPKKLKMQKQNR